MSAMSDSIQKRPAPFVPAAELRISDLETVRVIAEPLRFRLIQTMSTRPDEPWTVKEIAGVLGEPATKLYYHVGLLEEHGIVVVVSSRLVSGIVEKRYQLAAERFSIDRGLLAPDEASTGEALHSILGTVFDAARTDIEASVREGIASLHGSTEDAEGGREAVLLSHSLDRLSSADAAEFRTRLRALANEFGQRLERDEGGSANRAEKSTTPQETRPYGFVVAFYPMVDVPAPKAQRSRRSSSPSTGDTR
ncbi:MAG TPA: helix-turn-helix domain-containing protein [Candidatus Acidoferrum sp.]|nr:helix-turn-helix domain-containing protein [Candidatus Acidoferrum sp.]